MSIIEDKTYYLVTYKGTDNEDPKAKYFCERKYLFSSSLKAAEFVRKRTSGEGWRTHPAHSPDSMVHRIKDGGNDSYVTQMLVVDEYCEGKE